MKRMSVHSRADRDHGFTLIELLVVVIIIGALTSVAVPVFLNQRQKAVEASLKSDMRQAKTLLSAFVLEYPPAAIGSCFSVAQCSQSTQVGGQLALAPFNFKPSPGNAIGTFYYSYTHRTYRVCIENSAGGQSGAWYAYDSFDGGGDVGQGGSQGCPWISVGVKAPGR